MSNSPIEGWVPPEFAIGCAIILLLGGSWVVVGIYFLFKHLTIGWVW